MSTRTDAEDALSTRSGLNYCPHCGAELARSLPEHMARGLCDEHTAPIEQTETDVDDAAEPEPAPEAELPEPPTLENHDEREHPDDDLEARRELAAELADAGIWSARDE